MPGPDGSAPRRIAFAHSLRGLAGLVVVVGHYAGVFWAAPATVAGLIGAPEWSGPPPSVGTLAVAATFGHLGVALFFLISGFVIPFGLLGRGRGQFLLGRVVRLWPTYAAGLTVSAAAAILCSSHFGRPPPFDWRAYPLQLLFIRDLAWTILPIDGIVWTIEVEAKFYLLCAALAPALRAGRLAPLLAVAAGCTALTWVAAAPPAALQGAPAFMNLLYALSLSGQMITFMLIGLVLNALHRGRTSVSRALACIALLLAAFATQWLSGIVAMTFWPGFAMYMTALAGFSACYAARGRWRRTPAPLGWLADISYPLYVVHAVAGYALMRLALEAGFGPAEAILLACAFAAAAAWALHVLVEAPTQLASHRLGRAREPPSPGPLAAGPVGAPP